MFNYRRSAASDTVVAAEDMYEPEAFRATSTGCAKEISMISLFRGAVIYLTYDIPCKKFTDNSRSGIKGLPRCRQVRLRWVNYAGWVVGSTDQGRRSEGRIRPRGR